MHRNQLEVCTLTPVTHGLSSKKGPVLLIDFEALFKSQLSKIDLNGFQRDLKVSSQGNDTYLIKQI